MIFECRIFIQKKLGKKFECHMHKKFLFWQLWSCQLPGNNLYRMEAALPEPDEALMYFPYLYVHGKLFFYRS
ncbi:hypothetical protein RUMOBE_01274 [Blautia obeum ATCC 29174]|uniref:Uncharacterized protein n=1 Tax=Blautia obeum ATCC 29174 TaxID=411459 RepID=A5ZQK4_9FIRM|nr:hypothetical protein RUMOBE_01274 [Blautia obeum ATCC 29174]